MTNSTYSSIRTSLLSAGVFSLITLLFTGSVQAGEWSVGAGVAAEQLAYRDYDTQFMPVPIITYQGEQFFISGQGAGINIINTDTHGLSFNVDYSPLSFKPSDSSDPAMKKLDKRRATAMAGMGYQYNADWGTVSGKVATDVLGYSNGVLVDVGYQYLFQFGKLQLVPGIGMQWQSRSFNDYYFGVSKQESQRSGVAEYRAKSGVSSYLSLTSYYVVNDNWQLFLMGNYEQMSGTVKDSPMTGRDYSVTVATGVLYKF
ncbi:MipA/OmpV family protein [Serratia sp. D1N4]